MRRAIPTVLLLAATLLIAVGCGSSKGALVEENPRAEASRSRGFEPQAHGKIAVLVRDNTRRSYRRARGTRRQVEDVFAQEAARRGYRLATRSQVEAIKDEIRFEQNTIWTGRGAAEPGNLYNVSALLIVSIDEAFVRDEPSLTSKIPEPDRRDGFLSELLDNVLDSSPRETYYAEAGVSASLISVRCGAAATPAQ